MGPILICDKSTLQSLARGELNLLRRYYFLNIPPVLLVEILGDLKKHTDASMSRDEVRQLAEKMVPVCSAVNLDFRRLIRGELAGHPVSMDGRPVLGGGRHVISQDGKSGVAFQESAEAQAVLRWQNGAFQEAEEMLAEAWRRSTQSIDLEAMQRQLRTAYSGQLNLRTFADTVRFVDGLMESAPPDVLLMWFLRDVGLDLATHIGAFERLRPSGQRSLRALAPYTAHCIRIAMIFHFALAFGLIGTRPTNRVDLEYLYYTPFCHAFSSGDAFHRKTAPLILNTNQVFVERDRLKGDLKKLAFWWASLNDPQREQQAERIGPPEDETSVTHQLWKKVMVPDYRKLEPFNWRKLSPEAQKKLVENFKKHESGVPSGMSLHGSMDNCDFIVRKHMVRLNGPCICGSEKLFKDCCGRRLAKTDSST